jgi:hypothetical protein
MEFSQPNTNCRQDIGGWRCTAGMDIVPSANRNALNMALFFEKIFLFETIPSTFCQHHDYPVQHHLAVASEGNPRYVCFFIALSALLIVSTGISWKVLAPRFKMFAMLTSVLTLMVLPT